MAAVRLGSILAAIALVAEAHRMPVRHAQKPASLDVRQDGLLLKDPLPVVSVRTTSARAGDILTMITPSPGASPVAVTRQSQIVTSYVPQFTLCELPPMAFFTATLLPSARPTNAPYHNYSISIPPSNRTCSTVYTPTETTVCATTLSGLVTTYPVTNCAQEITFSSQYEYTLTIPTPTGNNSNATSTYPNATSNSAAMITPSPSIKTLTTYYVAPWQALTAATAPSDVVKEVCFSVPAPQEDGTVNECVTEYQIRRTALVSTTTTITSSLNISTTISGPSGVYIFGDIVANVTEILTTFSFTTTTEAEYQTHFTTTHKISASYSTAPTVTQTMTVNFASATPPPSGQSTTTVHLTSTTYVGTKTITLPFPSKVLPSNGIVPMV